MSDPVKTADQGEGTRGSGAPSVSLPKGGGAIQGIGEKFAANPATGTGSMAVPIATSPGRSGFGPKLSLSYDSGSGNGPFGFGWDLSLPAIARKTDKGLPRYRDAEESDVYVLSGAEDLVPVLGSDGKRPRDDESAAGYVIHRYRPRIEGLFSRIERWTNQETGEIHWRSITRDSVTSFYGLDNNSRVFDPEDPSPEHPTRIFKWLICQSYDDKGNAIVYEYASENSDSVDPGQANELNRTRRANRYLKRIKYGNRVSRLVQPDLTQAEWLFEVVLDYDEGHYEKVALDPAKTPEEQHRYVRVSDSVARAWSDRPDPFSSHRAGFEVRMHRRCRRVLMFHHIPDISADEKGYDGLVQSTEFDYADLDYADLDSSRALKVDDELSHQGSTRFASFIRAVTRSGYVREDGEPVEIRGSARFAKYLKKSLPPVEFEYSKAAVQDQVRELDAESLENLPIGLDGSQYQWVDLDGEGVSGILTEQGEGWFYKPNLGQGRFGPLQTIASKPAGATLSGGRQKLLDLAGDGRLDVVALDGPNPGFYERTGQDGWESFRPFGEIPNLNWDDRNLRFVDLNGDGHADVLITEQDVFTCHYSLAEQGFGPAERVPQAVDEEKGPRLVLADGTESIYLADMSGDGLTDLVRIRDGDVCYWPSRGYGRFGAKVTMDGAPRFDGQGQMDHRRVRVTDADGSGTSDLLYLARDGAKLYFNQSGNRFTRPYPLTLFPAVDDLTSVMTADILGNGTTCLVWSSPLPDDAGRPLRYIDLMGGVKPHLLVRSVNNLGAETEVQYASSTRFYLEDKAAGKPWITRLPFPVQVVERVTTRDHISGNLFVTRYAYHHGYFDGVDREFRGFGMVEHWDTEEYAVLNPEGQPPSGTNIELSSHVPPVLTKTWFHTGIYLGRDRVSNFFAGLRVARDPGEYYREPGLTDQEAAALGLDDEARGLYDDRRARELLLDDTVLAAGLTSEEEREACRALKGSMLRQEVYARDGSDKQERPYTVTEQNFTVRRLQPRAGNRHGVFLAHEREAVSYQYERSLVPVVDGSIVDEKTAGGSSNVTWLPDPRTSHSLTLEVDDFGNVLKSASIGYGRRYPDLRLPTDADRAKQCTPLGTCSEFRVTKDHDSANRAIDTHMDYRTPLPCETQTYELTGLASIVSDGRLTFDEVLIAVTTAPTCNYEETPPENELKKRLIDHERVYYRRNSLEGPLPLGDLQSLALPYESFKLAYTPGLVREIYGDRTDPSMFADDGGYVHLEGDTNWWAPSGRSFYSPDTEDTAAEERAYARLHFFLPHRYRDPFHTDTVRTESLLSYDPYDLLVRETKDALDNQVSVGERRVVLADGSVFPAKGGQDYRVLKPYLVMDANRNRSEVRFDALGMVVGTAVMGKPEDPTPVGDRLTQSFNANLTQVKIDEFFSNPKGPLASALLDDASTRFVYDQAAFHLDRGVGKRTPPVSARLARETHVSEPPPTDGLKIQVSLAYSDGLGQEIQRKIPAEPGPVPSRDGQGRILANSLGEPEMTRHAVSPRWVGSGWTVYNNKGKPTRKYEPFFTDSHECELDIKVGVAPVVFYDPAERAIATLHPNKSWEKVVYDPWQLATWDSNDTVLIAEPENDPHVGRFFGRLATSEYQPSWHSLRTDQANSGAAQERWSDPSVRAAEESAADKSSVHAGTPSREHADSLGRNVLSLQHNKYRYSNTSSGDQPREEVYSLQRTLDVKGHEKAIVDGKGRHVARYDYDVLANRIRTVSMEAGERLLLLDCIGNTIYAWDSLNHRIRTVYDQIRRASESRLWVGTGSEKVVKRNAYGESQSRPEQRNLRGQIFRQFDQAGMVTNTRYDFKGNLLESKRRIVASIDVEGARTAAYKVTVDWSSNVQWERDTYTKRAKYDALNRPTQLVVPHSDQSPVSVSILQPKYNDAGLLEQIHAWLDQNGAPSDLLEMSTASLPVISKAEYDAKGRRTLVDRATHDGKCVTTTYTYAHDTGRLTRIYTRRGVNPATRLGEAFTEDCTHSQPPPETMAAPDTPQPGAPCGLQSLHYTYDAAGNITHVRDDAQQTIYFKNQKVEPHSEYTYDATYRLIEAAGREHLGQVGGTPIPHSYNDVLRTKVQARGDGKAMGRYLERYFYDAAGNMRSMQHRGTDPENAGWTRQLTYAEPSQLVEGEESNRLTSATVGGYVEAYSKDGDGYDAHGNMKRMPQLKTIQWNFAGQLQMTRRQAVNVEDVEGEARKGERTWYVYDAAGNRMRKVTETSGGEIKEEWLYLGALEIYRRHHLSRLERESLRITDNGQQIAVVERRTQGHEPTVPEQLIRHQFNNHLGSSQLELNEFAQIVSYEEYTPYGSTAYQAVVSMRGGAKRYRNHSKERDEESGLCYHGARYYAPWLGRWASSDPEGLIDGENTYVAFRDCPTQLTDPGGTRTKDIEKTEYVPPELVQIGRLLEEEAQQTFTAEELAIRIDESLAVNESITLHEKAMRISDKLGLNNLPQDVERVTTVKLKNFNPPGWEAAASPDACYDLAKTGVEQTIEAGDKLEGGVVLYNAAQQRIAVDPVASSIAVEQMKKTIDQGHAVLGGVNEPSNAGVVSANQPVTDHFVAIYGYEVTESGNVVAFLAKDNAVAGTAEIRFKVADSGEIYKPQEPTRTELYLQQEYQLSEIRFLDSVPYTGGRSPTTATGAQMVW